jgi:hypothetical protein
MLKKRVALFLVALCCLWVVSPATVHAQTASAGLVQGVVSDPSKAVVSGATVALEPKGATTSQTAVTDSNGHFVFPNVEPGIYDVRVTAKGFRSSIVGGLQVDVQQSYTVNVTMALGSGSEVVEVTATTEAELQTTDASTGTVIGGEGMQRLPAFTRSASSLMFYQAGVSPSPSVPTSMAPSDTTGGQVTGARSEQITFNLDGGDATSDLEGSNSYVSPPGEPLPAPVVPVPGESTEEFRVVTSDPNATLGRSSGGQVAMLTKHGTNSFHGSAYEYHSDDGEGANSWTNNTLGINKPHQVDNRFGVTTGGPVLKNKLFFFVNYEGRRFNDASTFNVLVPTASLKAGELKFVDTAGNTDTYNFNPANGTLSSLCGGFSGTGTSPCDPRNIGISPVMQAQLALYPGGNNNFIGDGLNTTGFGFSIPTPISENIAVTRLDYTINSKWNLFGTWHWAKIDRVGTEQISIEPTPTSVSSDPFQPDLYTIELTGQLNPNLTMVTHGSFLRNWWGWDRQTPSTLGVAGTTQALEVAGEGAGQSDSLAKLLDDPTNINTQQARARIWDGHNWYIAQDYSWVKGRHVIQFGAAGYIWNDFHLRTDDVLGGLSSAPVLYIESTSNTAFGGNGANLNIGTAYEPLPCSTTVTTNCLNPTNGDSVRWDQLYSTLLGLVDRSAQIETRNGSFAANPLGTPLEDNVHMPSTYMYVQDIFQVKPGLTITAGLNYGIQLSPSESGGKEVLFGINGSTVPINFQTFLQQRNAAMVQGQVYDPQFDLIPTNDVTGPLRGTIKATDWKDLGPRLSAAWTVPWENKLFGNKATVIRGGYGLVFDRTSAVSEVLLPLLSGGLADVDQCAGPVTTNPGGGAGSFGGCAGAIPGTSPENAFRIGVDGSTVPLPAPSGLPVPYTPGSGFPLFLSAPLDPYLTPAHIHNFDLTIQRALPGKMFLEIGYIGRLSRNLPEGIALNTPDYMAKAGGQTLAQAFDAVAQQLRQGTPIASITPQPFFENFGQSTPGSGCLAAEASLGVGFASCTQFLASQAGSAFINGDLGGMMQSFDLNMANPMDSTQMLLSTAVSDKGFSNYNAGFVSLNKSFSNNLQMQFNWTWSHAIGDQGLNQQNDYSANSPFNYNIDKSSEPFDRRHVINAWWYYTLPFGKGRYTTSHSFVNRVIGGWYTSGIFTYGTGLPFYISADGDYGACCGLGSSFSGSGTAAVSSLNLRNQESLNNQGPSCSGGVASGGIGACGLPNIFGNPLAVFNSLSRPLLSANGQMEFDELRLFPIWNVDFSVGKNIIATERYKLLFSADFFNLFNHPELGTTSEYGNISADMAAGPTFGTISAQDNLPRKILLGLRFEF